MNVEFAFVIGHFLFDFLLKDLKLDRTLFSARNIRYGR